VREDGPVQHGDADGDRRASIDDLLDRAVFAINSGDRAAATALAGEVLAIDGANADAEDLLAACSGSARRASGTRRSVPRASRPFSAPDRSNSVV
jgi:hypothetical protein